MKKILYIITQSEFGGAQRYVFDLATNLSSRSASWRKRDPVGSPRDRFVATTPRDDDTFEIVVAAGEDPDGELFKKLQSPPLPHSRKETLPPSPPPLNKGGIKGGSVSIRTIYLPHLRRAISPWHDILAFFQIRHLIKQEKPDIIHLNSSKAGVLGSLSAKCSMLRVPCYVIYTAHGWVFNEPLGWLRQKIYFYAEKWTAKYKDKIICVSEHDRQVTLKSGFPEQKLATIHNGIDINNLDFLPKNQARHELLKILPRPPLKKDGEGIFIGTIANLYPTKGIEYLIEAARIIKSNHTCHPERSHALRDEVEGSPQPIHQNDKCIQPIFLVIGEGPERAKLENLIKKYSLQNNFFLLGHIPNASKYLKAFDIFVLPSVKEGFPYAILEAMAAGLPIIASNVGGIPEIISSPPLHDKEISPFPPFAKESRPSPPFVKGGVGGILTPPKNSPQLAEKIVYLLKNPSIAKNLAKESQQRVANNFNLDKMINETRKVYFL